MNDIEEKVAYLLKLAKADSEVSKARMAKDERDEARFAALYSIVQELASKAGVSPADLHSHFLHRVAYIHSKSLEDLETKNPSLAARIDFRPPDLDAAPQPFPSIFLPPSKR